MKGSGPSTLVWSRGDDTNLIKAVTESGFLSWDKMIKKVGRSLSDCKSRWYEVLRPLLKKDVWTREEDIRLPKLGKRHEPLWGLVSKSFTYLRTPLRCEDRYRTLLKDPSYQEVIREASKCSDDSKTSASTQRHLN